MRQVALRESFATAVYDFDINTAGADDIAALRSLIYERKVVALKNQRISRETYMAFAGQFGQLEQFKLKNYHDPEFPNILVINNQNQGGKAVGARKLGNMWHSDSSYLDHPLALSFLHAQKLPGQGGDTLFVDSVAALDTLPEKLRGQIIGRLAEHDVRWTYKVKEDDLGESITEIFDRLAKSFPATLHPTVTAHPSTGRRSLYVNPGYTTRVAGYGADESRALLNEIYQHVLKPDNIFAYQWEPNDLLIWDNRSVWHCATELSPEQERVMHRIGINDGAFFNSLESAA